MKTLNDVEQSFNDMTGEPVICCFTSISEFKSYLTAKVDNYYDLLEPGAPAQLHKATTYLGLQKDGSVVFSKNVSICFTAHQFLLHHC